MHIKIIESEFTSSDAIDIITQMFQVKVKYHENKISNTCIEEDIKFRESKIKILQNKLFEIRNYVENKGGNISLESTIKIES